MVETTKTYLKEDKLHLEAMLNGIADGVISVDNKNKVTFINDAAESIFCIKREDWLGKNFKHAHSPQSHKKALRLIKGMRAGKITAYSTELQVGKRDIIANFSPVSRDKECLGVVFIAKDITAMKRLQLELLNSEKLALVGKMISSIAHEVRNPLVPIGGFAKRLHKKLDNNPPLQKYTGIIIKEIDHLERLLHNILFSTKEIEPILQYSAVNLIIKDLLVLYEEIFSQKKIKVQTRLSPDIPKSALDPSLIKQALIDILINAIHAMPEGGLLTIKSEGIKKDSIDYISVSITDSGYGISEDIINNIFDPFFTTKVHGVGLGLALTRRVITAHHGNINVSSIVGKGTTFTIILPVKACKKINND